MVMIFTLVSAAQDWMNNFSDSEKQRKQDDDDKRREKEMEAELVSCAFYRTNYYIIYSKYIWHTCYELHNIIRVFVVLDSGLLLKYVMINL